MAWYIHLMWRNSLFQILGITEKKKTSNLIKAVNSHLLKLAAIKRKHNFRWQHLSQMKDSGLCNQECGVPLHDALVANAIMLLQACIHKSESTELFLTSLVATSIVKFMLPMLDS